MVSPPEVAVTAMLVPSVTVTLIVLLPCDLSADGFAPLAGVAVVTVSNAATLATDAAVNRPRLLRPMPVPPERLAMPASPRRGSRSGAARERETIPSNVTPGNELLKRDARWTSFPAT
ncbi:hypothetical protein Skr01_54670 [Sphaerisporangium krabiense]|nr:hypothetical protein Skr01_54670 [Sphaerisporangium krabiense]